jgi:aspartyl-tRNA(Asn)/glutamyl-tRNA(Gln) amidotransferase subunit B
MSNIPYGMWEAIIGLEIHVQLNTLSKMFSPSPNHFGDEPNTNISTICTGQPGSLPVINREAVRKAVEFGCAINADIQRFSKFDRKSYFYPDSPRNYQITQFYDPIIKKGAITVALDSRSKTFTIHHAHLEDDAGMLKHFTSFVGVDYNRAGVPLIEIVSDPCMHTAKEAVAYAMAIKAIAQYLDLSDCNMEEGSLRMDANISVRPKGSTELRTKIEIKNMNSFTNMEMAIDAEIQRQIIAYSTHPDENPAKVIESGTYRFDLEQKKTILMRKKELAEDYRYFPEPDLPPLILTPEYIKSVRVSLPELPSERYDRYLHKLGLSEYSASVLVNDKALSDYFERGLEGCANSKALCNWITVEFVGRLKGSRIEKSGILPEHIAHLVNMIEAGTITGRIAKYVADDMVRCPGKDSDEIVKENPDYQPLTDVSLIEPLVDQVLAENPQSVADYKAGKTKALAALVGKVMALSAGKASPDIVNSLLIKKIEKM